MWTIVSLVLSVIDSIVSEFTLTRIQFILHIITGTSCGLITIIVCLRILYLGHKRTKQCKLDDKDKEDITTNDAMITRFQEALRFKTISTEPEEFLKMIKFIKDTFKAIHTSKYVTMEKVTEHSLLYTVSGSKKSLIPYLLMAHLDVTPAEPNMWVVPPFGGKLKDGYVYSRGAMNFKNGVMAILEALEHILSKGFKPSRAFYIIFGHNEEINGLNSNSEVSNLLQKRGLQKLKFILDEGCTVLGEINGIAKVGITEKSILDLNLTVKGPSGHSALQNGSSPYGILAEAITKLEKTAHPSMLGKGPEKDMLENLAPVMNIWYRIMWSNIWLFKPVISRLMSYNPSTNALIRTVHCVVDIHGNEVDSRMSLIPEYVTACIRCSVHPAQTVNDIIKHFRKVINNKHVDISTSYKSRMASVSPYGDEDFGYQTICQSIQRVFQPYLIAPSILATPTDSEKYHMFTNNIYRFSPTVMVPGDDLRYNGKNERLSVKNYGQAINFYKNIMINADKSSL